MKFFNWIKSLFKRGTRTSVVVVIKPADHLREYEHEYTMTAPTYDEVEYGYGSVTDISVIEVKKAE
jgi:hypothetical protein